MQIKKITTNVFARDLEAFDKARKQGNKAEMQFIQNFILVHQKDNVTSSDEVYSLLLRGAISIKDLSTIKYILSKKFDSNILTIVDGAGFSPISKTLFAKDENILSLINSYIEINLDKIEKTVLSGEDKEHIINIIQYPQFENMDPIDCFNRLLVPLYTQDSLKELADLVGVYDQSDETNENWW